MSERLAAEIWIGGNIPGTLVPDLCAAITDEGVALEWGDGSFAPKTGEDLDASLRENEKHELLLWLCDDEASWGQFDDLEQFLQEHRIPFTRRTAGNAAYDPEVVEYRPNCGAITLAANVDGRLTVDAAELEPVEHMLDAAIKLAEVHSDANFLSLVQTALKLLREQLPRPLPPLEPFSIEPKCGSKGGDDDDDDDEEETEEDEEDEAVAGG